MLLYAVFGLLIGFSLFLNSLSIKHMMLSQKKNGTFLTSSLIFVNGLLFSVS